MLKNTAKLDISYNADGNVKWYTILENGLAVSYTLHFLKYT